MLPPVDRRRMRQRKACIQCTRSKRKCDKTTPACKRCIERNDNCEYDSFPRRPPVNDSITASTSHDSSPPNTQPWDTSLPLSPTSLSGPHPPMLPSLDPSPFPDPHLSPRTITPHTWFLHPTTFTRQHGLAPPPPFLPTGVGASALPHFISTLQSWLRRWTTTLHSPLIHRSAFVHPLPTTTSSLPPVIQDVLTTLLAYYAATPAAKSTVLEILTDRAELLVAEHRLRTGPASAGEAVVVLDTRGHLARTLALLAYQVIALFDGDIRARSMAEERSDILQSWGAEMLESVTVECASAEVLARTGVDSGGSDLVAALQGDEEAGWKAWVVVESVRRVFLMGEYVQSVYTTMKRGWSVCPGGLAFTAGEGLWDEMVGWRWRRRVGKLEEEKGALLVRSMEAYLVMLERERGEVDEFTQAVLEISYGLEAMENGSNKARWDFGHDLAIMAGRSQRRHRDPVVPRQGSSPLSALPSTAPTSPDSSPLDESSPAPVNVPGGPAEDTLAKPGGMTAPRPAHRLPHRYPEICPATQPARHTTTSRVPKRRQLLSTR
ncbi:hypothetical protein QBC39DRAFT_306979 [Podospora conica]|nr:hypothetical protein QBC39DRAFT_306979 [Schizothecium conicum]